MGVGGDSLEPVERLRRCWRAAATAVAELVRHDRLASALDHWTSLWADGGLPGRIRIDPTEIGPVLPHVFLMDYDAASRTLRYRLVGQEIRERYPTALRGMALEEVVEPAAQARVARYFLACVELPAIALLTGRLYQERERPAEGQRLLLPLLDGAGRGEGLLGITLCERFFPSQEEAMAETERHLVILPLDGSEAIREST